MHILFLRVLKTEPNAHVSGFCTFDQTTSFTEEGMDDEHLPFSKTLLPAYLT